MERCERHEGYQGFGAENACAYCSPIHQRWRNLENEFDPRLWVFLSGHEFMPFGTNAFLQLAHSHDEEAVSNCQSAPNTVDLNG